MPKPNFVFLAISILILLSFPAKTFSQNTTTEEIFTIETYYPAPYGVYNEMRSNKMVIGDSNASSTPSPATPGVVRFKGLGVDPAAANDSQPGALYYNANDNNFKYHNGTSWQRFGGLPPNYQWITTIGESAFALKEGATATTSCAVPRAIPGCYNDCTLIGDTRADVKYNSGQFQIRAWVMGLCDSGWIAGTQASCGGWACGGVWEQADAKVVAAGVKITGTSGNCFTCEAVDEW